MLIQEKIRILAEGAKYDVSCTSSGSDRRGQAGKLGATAAPGICHSWSADGRCISLLKILMSNACSLNCAYCINRSSAPIERATMTPDEIVNLTIAFYRRNYIEGLFLSSGVIGTPDETMARMLHIVKKLRLVHHFNGYIHIKGIPGASIALIDEVGGFVDRMSINLELPDEGRLKLLAPGKDYQSIDKPMQHIANRLKDSSKWDRTFVPAGQSSQLMVGTGGDTDLLLLNQARRLYRQYQLRRVFYSAYIPIKEENALLPSKVEAPLLREHRLYQSDWLFRFYGFEVDELLDERHPNLPLKVDPKAYWAVRNLDYFPVELTRAPLEMLLRVPGIGPTSAKRILASRRYGALTEDALKRMGVVLKRARYFITLHGLTLAQIPSTIEGYLDKLAASEQAFLGAPVGQISLFETNGLQLGTMQKN